MKHHMSITGLGGWDILESKKKEQPCRADFVIEEHS